MKILKLFSFLPLFLFCFSITGQVRKDSIAGVVADPYFASIAKLESREIFKRKGNFFFYWGYNRSAYTKSDIHFSGDGYDFTINDIEAEDHQTTTLKTYIGPTTFTVPQYNYRLGYYINDKTFISLGEDHMKYEIEKQVTRLYGSVESGNNIGDYYNTEVLVGEGDGGGNSSFIDALPKGFVSEFEHCDGLNDASFELGRIEQLWIAKNSKHALAVIGTIGSGLVIPDTDADVLGHDPYHNKEGKTYHLAGYSFSASIGFEFNFYKNFFLQTRLKGGYINLPDINTTVEGGKANQHFGFLEPMLVVGYTRSFGKH